MPAPTVTSISRTLGSSAGGVSVTLTGTNFTGTTGVTFGGTAATSVVVVNDTTLTCVTPAHAIGVASVLVTNGSGTNGSNSLFIYIPYEPLPLYVWFLNGQDGKVCDDWNGEAPTEEGLVDSDGAIVGTAGQEVSEPYRNIHPYSTEINVKSGSTLAGALTLKGTSLVPASVAPADVVGGPVAVLTTLGTLAVKTSDQVSGTKPHQFAKVYTWLIFTGATGIYKYRKSKVVGYAQNPRTE